MFRCNPLTVDPKPSNRLAHYGYFSLYRRTESREGLDAQSQERPNASLEKRVPGHAQTLADNPVIKKRPARLRWPWRMIFKVGTQYPCFNNDRSHKEYREPSLIASPRAIDRLGSLFFRSLRRRSRWRRRWDWRTCCRRALAGDTTFDGSILKQGSRSLAMDLIHAIRQSLDSLRGSRSLSRSHSWPRTRSVTSISHRNSSGSPKSCAIRRSTICERSSARRLS